MLKRRYTARQLQTFTHLLSNAGKIGGAFNKPVAALALGVFDGKLYAGTENGLVIVDIAAR